MNEKQREEIIERHRKRIIEERRSDCLAVVWIMVGVYLSIFLLVFVSSDWFADSVSNALSRLWQIITNQ